MDVTDKCFASPDDEIKYWKQLAEQYKQGLDEAREELDEFQISSHDLEQELEAQLNQQENRIHELTAANARLQMEVESLREKLEQEQGANHKMTTALQNDLAKVTAITEELQKYIRELEQANDDLERSQRTTVVSLEDFESRLNLALERNAILESELEDREGLFETVQRLKDEARDLRQEMAIKDKINKPVISNERDYDEKSDHIDSNKLMEEAHPIPSSTPIHKTKEEKAMSPPTTPIHKKPYISGQGGNTPMTPSARISALNIVGDLLRKVGALETKLASCRNFVKDQPRHSKSGSTSPTNSPRSDPRPGPRSHRTKRLNRGTTLPSPTSVSSQQSFVKIAV